MPKGLILLILLLLVGGYFLISPILGGESVSEVPYITGSAKVVSSGKAYTVVLDGKISLPSDKEYEIQSVRATLLVNGVEGKTETFSGGTVKGPGEYPFSFSPTVGKSASNVSIRVEANVSVGKTAYMLSQEMPVALPDPSALMKPPVLDVSLADVSLLGDSKSVTLVVGVSNPNDSKMTLSDLVVKFGTSDYPVGISSVDAGKRASGEVSFTVPSDVSSVSISIVGNYSVDGTEGAINRSFDMNIPVLTAQPLVVDVFSEYTGISESGYTVKFSGSVKNPNAFVVSLDALTLHVENDGNYSYDVNVLGKEDILPGKTGEFNKSVTIDDDFTSAVAEFVAHYSGKSEVVARFPIGVSDPSDFIDAPEVWISVSEGNTCVFAPHVKNPNDFNISVSLKLSVKQSGTEMGSKDYGTIVVPSNGQSGDLSSLDLNVSGDVNAILTGSYGVGGLGVMIPFHFFTEFRCG